MHHLLIPYALLSVAFIMQFHMRRDASVKAGLMFTAGATLLVMFVAMAFRPVDGDSWRYYQFFQILHVRGAEWAYAMRDQEPLWATFNWFVSVFGDQPWLLFGSTLLVYMSVFFVAIWRLAGPVGATILVMCYAAFPFFVSYAASGLRQGLAMAFLLMAYVYLYQGRRRGWVWLLLAPLWHSGSWLGAAVAAIHWAMCRWIRRESHRWLLVSLALGGAVGLSFSGLNETVMGGYGNAIGLAEDRYIYFTGAEAYGYRAGFRLDFFLFSMLPLFSAWLLRRSGRAFSYEGPGWWLSLYLSLNAVYHLFAFAPFADRFAAFSWILMPLVVYLQVRETGNRYLLTLFVSLACVVDVVMLQFYTGQFIRAPAWWG